MEKKSFMKKLTGSREALLAVILVLLFVVITIISPSFLTFKSLTDMLKNNAVTMVMSLGMLCVMLVGGIDISIMSTLALTGMSIGMLLKYEHISSTFLAFVIALAIGIACGFLVGLVISRADVPPIIATMGFMYIYRAMDDHPDYKAHSQEFCCCKIFKFTKGCCTCPLTIVGNQISHCTVDVIMAGKSGRSINNVPKSPVKQMIFSWEGILVLLFIAENIF